MELQTKILTNCKDSQNPFRWKPHSELEIIPNNLIDRMKRKMAEKVMEDELEYEIAILPLIICYEYYVKNQMTEALHYLEDAEKKIEIFIDRLNDTSPYYRCIPAVRHLISSSKTYILVQMNNLDDAYQESCKIKSVSEDPVIWGLKAAFYCEYGICGTKVALKCAIKANEMNPDDSMWYFLKGKYLGRLRRVEKPFDIPSEVELKCLEKALDKEMRASYTIFTAQIYRETARLIYSNEIKRKTLYPKIKFNIDKMNEKSHQLYEKSLELKPKCPHMKFRCAKGFIMLPEPFRNDELGAKLLDDAFKLAPDSPYGHHVAAQFYERRKKNHGKAKYHLRIAAKHGVFGAAMDLLRLELFNKEITELDAVSRLEKFYDEYVEPTRRCQLLAQLTSYYIFEKQDIHKAFENFRKLLLIDVNDLNILNHRSIFLKYRETFPLRDVLIDEIRLSSQNSTCTTEERKILTDYLIEMHDLGIEIKKKPPMFLKNKIQKDIANNQHGNRRGFASSSKYSNKKPEYGYVRSKADLGHVRINDSFVTESDLCRVFDSFGESWKKNIRTNQRYQAPKFSGKDYSKNEEMAVDNDDTVSSLRLQAYQKTNQILSKKSVSTNDDGDSDSLVKIDRRNLVSANESKSSKIERSPRKSKTFNDGDDSDRSSKMTNQQNSTLTTASHDDFDQLMANYRKMKISQSLKKNDGNAVRESNSCRNEKKNNNTNDDETHTPNSKEKQKNLNRHGESNLKVKPEHSSNNSNSNYEKTRGNLHRDAEARHRKVEPKHERRNSDDYTIEIASRQLNKPFKPGNIRF